MKPPYEGAYRNRYEALISIADDDDAVQSIGQGNYINVRLLRRFAPRNDKRVQPRNDKRGKLSLRAKRSNLTIAPLVIASEAKQSYIDVNKIATSGLRPPRNDRKVGIRHCEGFSPKQSYISVNKTK